MGDVKDEGTELIKKAIEEKLHDGTLFHKFMLNLWTSEIIVKTWFIYPSNNMSYGRYFEIIR